MTRWESNGQLITSNLIQATKFRLPINTLHCTSVLVHMWRQYISHGEKHVVIFCSIGPSIGWLIDLFFRQYRRYKQPKSCGSVFPRVACLQETKVKLWTRSSQWKLEIDLRTAFWLMISLRPTRGIQYGKSHKIRGKLLFNQPIFGPQNVTKSNFSRSAAIIYEYERKKHLNSWLGLSGKVVPEVCDVILRSGFSAIG